MPRAYVSSLVAARSASCAFGRSVMAGSIRTDRYTEPPSVSPSLPREAVARASSCTLRLPKQGPLALGRVSTLEDKPCSIPIGMYTTGKNHGLAHRKGVEHAFRKGESAQEPLGRETESVAAWIHKPAV